MSKDFLHTPIETEQGFALNKLDISDGYQALAVLGNSSVQVSFHEAREISAEGQSKGDHIRQLKFCWVAKTQQVQ